VARMTERVAQMPQPLPALTAGLLCRNALVKASCGIVFDV